MKCIMKIIKGSLVTHNPNYFPGKPSNLIGIVLKIEMQSRNSYVYTVWWTNGLILPYPQNQIINIGLK